MSPLLLLLGASLWACGPTETSAPGAAREEGTGGFVPDTKPIPPVRWLDATVPNGTRIELSLIDSLDSRSSRKGDPLRTLVTEAIMMDGTVLVPSGSNVLGVVSDVVPASSGFKGKGGMLLLEFNRIETPTGASAPLKARLAKVGPTRSSAALAGSSDPGAVTAGSRGKEALLEPDTSLTIVLVEPLPIKVKQ